MPPQRSLCCCWYTRAKTHTYLQSNPTSESSFIVPLFTSTRSRHIYTSVRRLIHRDNILGSSPLTVGHTTRYMHSHSTSFSFCSFHWRLSLPCPLIKAICSPDPLHEKSVLFSVKPATCLLTDGVTVKLKLTCERLQTWISVPLFGHYLGQFDSNIF